MTLANSSWSPTMSWQSTEV